MRPVEKFETLWHWIGRDSANRLREVSDDDIEALDVAFKKLSHAQKTDVYIGYQQALAATDNLKVWELGSLLDGFPLGDDSFRDFQRWLILQGRAVFTIATTDPDGIASLLRNRDDVPEVDVYSMGILDEFEDRFDLAGAIPMGEGIGVHLIRRRSVSKKVFQDYGICLVIHSLGGLRTTKGPSESRLLNAKYPVLALCGLGIV
jgi:hypothetical protein